MGGLWRGSRSGRPSRRATLPRLHPGRTAGWVAGARRVPSPNQDERPGGERPTLIVIHGISLPPGEFGGPWIDRLFSNALDPSAHPAFASLGALRVSSHFLIRRTGEVVQYVPVGARAWHAGVSRFRGRQRCNDFSVGIELEGADEVPYTAVQYERLCATIRSLWRVAPGLARAPVVGHSDIAPGRKTDPGPAFDWDHLERLLGRRWPRARPSRPTRRPARRGIRFRP